MTETSLVLSLLSWGISLFLSLRARSSLPRTFPRVFSFVHSPLRSRSARSVRLLHISAAVFSSSPLLLTSPSHL